MSINRIDFQGSFAQTSNISQVKAAEDARPQADQNAFQVQFQKEKEAYMPQKDIDIPYIICW